MQEGRAISHGLQAVGLDEGWLEDQWERLGIPKGDVFSAWLATNGALIVDRCRDRLH